MIMKLYYNILPPDESIICFEDDGFKIEAFKSVVKKFYVIVSYGLDSVTYPCNTSLGAHFLADQLIYEYSSKIRSVNKFFDSF